MPTRLVHILPRLDKDICVRRRRYGRIVLAPLDQRIEQRARLADRKRLVVGEVAQADGLRGFFVAGGFLAPAGEDLGEFGGAGRFRGVGGGHGGWA